MSSPETPQTHNEGKQLRSPQILSEKSSLISRRKLLQSGALLGAGVLGLEAPALVQGAKYDGGDPGVELGEGVTYFEKTFTGDKAEQLKNCDANLEAWQKMPNDDRRELSAKRPLHAYASMILPPRKYITDLPATSPGEGMAVSLASRDNIDDETPHFGVMSPLIEGTNGENYGNVVQFIGPALGRFTVEYKSSTPGYHDKWGKAYAHIGYVGGADGFTTDEEQVSTYGLPFLIGFSCENRPEQYGFGTSIDQIDIADNPPVLPELNVLMQRPYVAIDDALKIFDESIGKGLLAITLNQVAMDPNAWPRLEEDLPNFGVFLDLQNPETASKVSRIFKKTHDHVIRKLPFVKNVGGSQVAWILETGEFFEIDAAFTNDFSYEDPDTVLDGLPNTEKLRTRDVVSQKYLYSIPPQSGFTVYKQEKAFA